MSERTSLLLLDILRGYSKITYKYKKYYFKHFKIYDSLKLEEFESDCIHQAKKQGIKGEKQLLEQAIKRGNWSKEEEASQKDFHPMPPTSFSDGKDERFESSAYAAVFRA